MAPPWKDEFKGTARIRTVLLAALLLAGLAGLPVGGASPAVVHPAAAHSWVNLTVTDLLTFVPTAPSPDSHSVTFEVRNAGTTDHTFTVSSRVNQSAPSGTTADNTPGSWFDNAHVLVDVSVPAGKTVFANATFPSDGSYQFLCRIHFPSMSGTLTVGTAPTSHPGSSTPWIFYGVAVVVVVVIVAAVGAVAARRMRRPPAAAPASSAPP